MVSRKNKDGKHQISISKLEGNTDEAMSELQKQGWEISYEGKTGYTLVRDTALEKEIYMSGNSIEDDKFDEEEWDGEVEFKAYIQWELEGPDGGASSYEHINSIDELIDWAESMRDRF